MSQESVGKLFMDFAKLDENSSMNRHGVGLGLSICKNLIEAMGGRVNVYSRLDHGTKFTINLKTSCILKNHETSAFFSAPKSRESDFEEEKKEGSNHASSEESFASLVVSSLQS